MRLPLTAQPAAAALEERKVVTVLFCDLVGFTAASDAADPEDVRARIRPYHARLRQEIERYGGTVEKFIGDAVMAVFGAPIAHEDDAERAIRAALRLLEAIDDLNDQDAALALQVRIGINTGEAVVALGARPEEGEGFVTGDVVNTASRLQGAAPVDGIAVSEATYRQTERIFDYETLAPVRVKGKAEPLALYRPLAARARFGSDVTRTHATPLVGRELEKTLLVGTFERSAQQRTCQLVTIVGEPGVGKSRLAAELFQHIDERPDLVTWRQGRCLPVRRGDRVLGARGDREGRVRHPRLRLAGRGRGQARSALCPSTSRIRSGSRPAWPRSWACPPRSASQEESFTAWRRFLEALAATRVRRCWSSRICTGQMMPCSPSWSTWPTGRRACRSSSSARPAPSCTSSIRPGQPGCGTRPRSTLPRSPTRRPRACSPRSSSARSCQQTPSRPCSSGPAGTPLYAEEFVRLLADQDFRSGGLEGVQLPDSVQALIAARLDTLTPDRKSLLQDASVMGKLFWAGALADMGDRDPREVELALHELARKELVRPARTSSMAGEAEYGFWHLLVRDVCYGQIPRAGRAARHRVAAAWLEHKAGDRAEDLADVLAYHYLSALELGGAATDPDQATRIEASAIRYLAMAAERALALDVTRAEASLAKALALAPAGHPERAWLLERWAHAAQQQNRLQETRDAYEEALTLYREQHESVAAGRVLTLLSVVAGRMSLRHTDQELLDEGLALLEAQPPGPELVAAYVSQAGKHYVVGRPSEAIVAAEQALALAAELGLPEPVAALGFRGGARCTLGEREGLEDMRSALALAVDQGQGRTAAQLHNNLADSTWQFEGPAAALAACREGIDFCERRGIVEYGLSITGMSATMLAALGLPEEALAVAEPVAERLEASGDIFFTEPRSTVLRQLVERGQHEGVAGVDEFVATARDSDSPQVYAHAFTAAARLLLAQGHRRQASDLLVEVTQLPEVFAEAYYAESLPAVVRTALALGDPGLAARLVDGVEPVSPLFEHALAAARAQLAEADGHHAEAVSALRRGGRALGSVRQRPRARLRPPRPRDDA